MYIYVCMYVYIYIYICIYIYVCKLYLYVCICMFLAGWTKNTIGQATRIHAADDSPNIHSS